MKTASLSARDRVLTIMPSAAPGTDYEGISTACIAGGARYDNAAKLMVLQPRKLPEFIAATREHGLRLTPSTKAIECVRTEAHRLVEEAEFLDGLGGDLDLFDYQKDGVAFLWRGEARLFFDEMGLGKTVQALVAIEPGAPALVICPKSVKKVWADECKRWRRDMTIFVVNKGSDFRYPERGELVVCSYDMLPPITPFAAKPWTKTQLIFDEAHALKNSRTKRTMNCRMLAKRVRQYHGAVWALTGTPLLNKPNELWALLSLLDLGAECYGGFHKFAKLFGGREDVFGFVWDGIVDSKALEPIRAYALRRERVDVLKDLPPKRRRIIDIKAPTGALLTMLDEVDIDEIVVSLEENGEPRASEGLMTARKDLALYKFKQALWLIEDFEEQGEPLIVFSAHRGPIEELVNRDGWATIMGGTTQAQRDKTIDDFQAGRLKGIGLTIGAGREGITLTRAAHVLFIDKMWTPAYNMQAEDRAYRIGQTRGLLVTDLVCDHEVDRRVNEILTIKAELVAETVDKLSEKSKPTGNRRALAQDLLKLADRMEGKKQ